MQQNFENILICPEHNQIIEHRNIKTNQLYCKICLHPMGVENIQQYITTLCLQRNQLEYKLQDQHQQWKNKIKKMEILIQNQQDQIIKIFDQIRKEMFKFENRINEQYQKERVQLFTVNQNLTTLNLTELNQLQIYINKNNLIIISNIEIQQFMNTINHQLDSIQSEKNILKNNLELMLQIKIKKILRGRSEKRLNSKQSKRDTSISSKHSTISRKSSKMSKDNSHLNLLTPDTQKKKQVKIAEIPKRNNFFKENNLKRENSLQKLLTINQPTIKQQNQPNMILNTCSNCNKQISKNDCVTLQCHHCYCNLCFNQIVQNQIEQNTFSGKICCIKCKVKIKISYYKQFKNLSDQVFDQQLKVIKSFAPQKYFASCSNCSYFWKLNKILPPACICQICNKTQ